MGVAEKRELPFSEAEAAARLGISKATLMRERVAGKIHPIRISQRIIKYTDEILNEYQKTCRKGLDKSATSGSAKGADHNNGAAHGSMLTLDRRDALALAQSTFKRRS